MPKLKLCMQLMLNDKTDCDIEAMDVDEDRLYTSAEGGVLRIWTCDNLAMVDELNAKRGPVLSMVVNGKLLYASHTDCSIIVWDLDKKKIAREYKYHTEPVSVLRIYKNRLYSGDYEGKVAVWDLDGKKLVKEFENAEETWDMSISDDYLYTIRDRDLLIQTHGKQVRKTIEGRGPFCRVNGKIILPTRDGLNIQIIDEANNFTRSKTLEGGDRIINAVACSSDGSILYTGGWDNCVHCWDLNTFTHLTQCDVGQVVNQIRVQSDTGHIYVAGNSGLIAKLMYVK